MALQIQCMHQITLRNDACVYHDPPKRQVFHRRGDRLRIGQPQVKIAHRVFT